MRSGIVVFCLLVLTGITTADSITFDFSEGIGPNFTTTKQRPFWNIQTDATGLRISKLADDGSTFVVPDTRSDVHVVSARRGAAPAPREEARLPAPVSLVFTNV